VKWIAAEVQKTQDRGKYRDDGADEQQSAGELFSRFAHKPILARTTNKVASALVGARQVESPHSYQLEYEIVCTWPAIA
jgi:hypothetical protein